MVQEVGSSSLLSHPKQVTINNDMTDMKPRMIFIHGNGSTHWSFAWAPWLKKELESLGFETFFETFPDSVIARSEYWLPFLQDHIKAGESDVLIGWSSGAVAAMRYAESHKLRGSILISPSHTDLGDDLEIQSGYFKDSWNWQKVKDNQQNIALVYGDDDPYIPQTEFQYIAEKLSSVEMKVPKGKHFSELTEFPQVLAYIEKTYSGR